MLVGCDRPAAQRRPDARDGGATATHGEGLPPPAQQQPLSATGFCRLIYEAPKRHLAAACSAEQQQTSAYRELVALAELPTHSCWQMLHAGLQDGRLRIQAANANRCARALEAGSWKDTLATRSLAHLPACRELLVGLQVLGSPCRASVECQAGLHCAGGSEGKCAEPAALGFRCETPGYALLGEGDGDCQASMYCDRPAFLPGSAVGLLHGSGAGASASEAAPRDADKQGSVRPSDSRGKVRVRPPRVRGDMGGSRGRLPAEVIERIVRQNFGRFRLCYERGLLSDPKLEGRVTVRFVIGRDGRVSSVGGGGDLPDSGVVSCVTRAFYGLSFPQPEGGVVTVSYPLAFTRGQGGASDPGVAKGFAAVTGAYPRTFQCLPRKKEGDTCGASRDCDAGLRCRVGKCRPPGEQGDDCDADESCKPGLFCGRSDAQRDDVDAGEATADAARVCLAPLPDGAACSRHLQCQGACNDGKCIDFCSPKSPP